MLLPRAVCVCVRVKVVDVVFVRMVFVSVLFMGVVFVGGRNYSESPRRLDPHENINHPGPATLKRRSP